MEASVMTPFISEDVYFKEGEKVRVRLLKNDEYQIISDDPRDKKVIWVKKGKISCRHPPWWKCDRFYKEEEIAAELDDGEAGTFLVYQNYENNIANVDSDHASGGSVRLAVNDGNGRIEEYKIKKYATDEDGATRRTSILKLCYKEFESPIYSGAFYSINSIVTNYLQEPLPFLKVYLRPLEGRYAFIAANKYSDDIKLPATGNDAEMIEEAVKSLQMSFNVTLAIDTTETRFWETMDKFCGKVNSDNRSEVVIFFYFTGHGGLSEKDQVIVVDASPRKSIMDATFSNYKARIVETSSKYTAINVSNIRDKLCQTKATTCIFVLDCCRNAAEQEMVHKSFIVGSSNFSHKLENTAEDKKFNQCSLYAVLLHEKAISDANESLFSCYLADAIKDNVPISTVHCHVNNELRKAQRGMYDKYVAEFSSTMYKEWTF